MRYLPTTSGQPVRLTHTLRANHRFVASRGYWHNQAVFCKQIQPGVMQAEDLQREVDGLQAFHALAHHADLPFKVPKLLYHDRDKLLTTLAPGRHLTHKQIPVEFWVRSFVAMDTMFRQPVRRLPQWSKPNPETGEYIWQTMRRYVTRTADWAIAPTLLEACLTYLQRHANLLEARPMHGDFTDGNVLVDGDTYWAIDFESFRGDWARWYDVVNFTYNRMIQYPEDTPHMQRILRGVVEQLGTSPTTQHEIRFSAIMRGLSFLIKGTTVGGRGHANTTTMTEPHRYRINQSLSFLVHGGNLYRP